MADSLIELGMVTPFEMRGPELGPVVDRILQADDADEADMQLKLETLLAIYKLKRMLFIVLVVVPLLVAVATVVIIVTSRNQI
ncbi:hypothetical protein [Amycolatopsis sp. WQ 127309]|uniref:hypothetical protein n=1 Tax=Amycolatopsis sp. WQ 127309 TaxID=2932773 RepID=UPI001FF1CBC2|nr:hypothetical protein [Amycolatopsis sp. WQ 127309]UOZ04642.1 hypothetical protein MUY22_38295 [Amycolatopsis sp. WQ 127309]